MNQLNGSEITEVKKVVLTPSMAAELLERNISNRPIRNYRVDDFVAIIKNDEWVMTHQGIAVGQDGVLYDGQHRLMAIKRAGKPVPVLLTTGLQPKAKLAIDIHAKRTYSDVLNIDKAELAPVIELCRVYTSNVAPQPSTVERFAPIFLQHSKDLSAFGKNKRSPFKSGPVMAGAVLRLAMGEDKQFVLDQFKNMIELNTDAISPAAKSFVMQVTNGTIAIGNQSGFGASRVKLIKSFYIFGKENAPVTKVSIKNMQARIEEIREIVRKLVDKAA